MEQGSTTTLQHFPTSWPPRTTEDVETVAMARARATPQMQPSIMNSQAQELDRRKRRRGHGGIRLSPGATEMDFPLPRRQLRRTPTTMARSVVLTLCLLLFLSFSTVPGAEAAFVSFQNCLGDSTLKSSPQKLHFEPLWVDAKFDTKHSTHTLNITVYGNVTGQNSDEPYPDPNHWNASNPDFNIVDATINFTTLFADVNVLSYPAWHPNAFRFCNETLSGQCPWQPLFNVSRNDIGRLHAFALSNPFYSSYSFASFSTMLRVQSGSEGAPMLACISAGIAPDLGMALSDALRYVPAAILALVGIATVLAARFSPWSSEDVFYWTSNYGRDDDILRLVTPGFGDCLQYIQFVVLAGSLSLGYPGFYQPVVSRASWSVLMFNESFVSHGDGTQSLKDGVYATNGTYGLTRLSQLAGMSHDEDVWAGMAVWLCVIIISVILLCQLGFALRTLVRRISKITEEDLQSKNLPFTLGNITRILFNYFLLPIISLSMFQLVVATRSPAYVVALAAILIVAIIVFAAWIFRLIFTTRPRVHLFDHLPLLLAYGPLYNTYSDEAAPYSFIPFLLTFIRGIAMGAVQPSGIAQIVILAICEVILILTLHAFKPFQSLTSMNAYHTFFSVVRLITTLLMIAFVPALDVSESIKGWIGYAILLLHAMVLIFGFFLNSIQTMLEVCARLAGAGRETRGGLATAFGMRQLSKRVKRPGPRASMGTITSHATVLEDKSMRRASRTLSASSTMMLNSTSPDNRGSTMFESFSQEAGSTISGTSPGPSTPGGSHSPFSFLHGAGARKSSKNLEPSDPYYRQPRPRRPTNEVLEGETREAGEEPAQTRTPQPLVHAVYSDLSEAPSVLGSERGSVGAAYFRAFHNDSGDLSDQRRLHTDYSTRESDFYYGMRGPALSSLPTRRLKTGPADPMSPVASASGWFKTMFGGKTKKKNKGFEVVRSTPLHLLQEHDEEPVAGQEPYHDSPEKSASGALAPEGPSRAIEEEDTAFGANRASEDSSHYPQDESELIGRPQKISDTPPMLGPISATGSLHMPSRSVSQATSASNQPPLPPLPRRNSKRNSKGEPVLPRGDIGRMASFRGPGNSDPEARVPFTSLNADLDSESKDRSARNSMASSIYPTSEAGASEIAEGADNTSTLPTLAPPARAPSRPSHERARLGTPRTGRIGSFQGDEFVYSHPYDGHFSTSSGPSYMPANANEERPMNTGRVVKHFARENVYTGDIHQGSEAELVEEEERKNSLKR